MYVFVTVFVSHSRLLDSLSLFVRGTRTDWLLAVAGCLDVRMPQCWKSDTSMHRFAREFKKKSRRNDAELHMSKKCPFHFLCKMGVVDRLTLLYKTTYCTYRGYGKTLLYSTRSAVTGSTFYFVEDYLLMCVVGELQVLHFLARVYVTLEDVF